MYPLLSDLSFTAEMAVPLRIYPYMFRIRDPGDREIRTMEGRTTRTVEDPALQSLFKRGI